MRLKIGFSFWALLTFCLLTDAGSAWLVPAVVLHECGHALALWGFGAPPGRLTLSALGCRMESEGSGRLSYSQRAAVSLAGPAVNLLCAAGMLLLGREEMLFARYSLALGLFHLLPIEPLDGGLALRALAENALGERRGARLSFVLSLFLLIPLAVLGFLLLLQSKNNFSLLLLSLAAMLILVLEQGRPLPGSCKTGAKGI